MDWIEVAVRGVDGEAAEALHEIMNRYGQGGAVIEQVVATETSAHYEAQPLVVKTYVPSGKAGEERLRQLREAIWHLSVIYPMPEPEIRRLAQQDWAEAWKEHYTRLRVGERLVIIPAWDEEVVDEGLLPLRIDPGMAFGTGNHPSTQLCLAMMEHHLRPGDSVFDVGSGSGILSVAAVRLGAGRVVASDLDPVAVEATRENAALNQVEKRLDVVRGSVDAWDGPFDLIVINILAEVIVVLLPQASLRLSEGGRILLAGIIAEREGIVLEVIELLGFQAIERLELGDWVGLTVTRGEELA